MNTIKFQLLRESGEHSPWFKKWACLALLMFILGNANPSLSYFSVQFYRIKIHDSISVTEIEKKNHFYVVSGSFKQFDAIYYLSRNILHSKLLASFKIQDTLIKIDGENFKLFLKTSKLKKKSNKIFVSVDKPLSVVDLAIEKKISGSCFPDGRRVNIFGNINRITKCENGKWSVELNLVDYNNLYVFAQISDSSGGIFFDGRSYIQKEEK